MNTDIDDDFVLSVTLWPDEAEELHCLLGQLEDWLLHASDETLAELGDFVEHLDPRDDVRHVIDQLGHYGVHLRRRSHRGDR